MRVRPAKGKAALGGVAARRSALGDFELALQLRPGNPEGLRHAARANEAPCVAEFLSETGGFGGGGPVDRDGGGLLTTCRLDKLRHLHELGMAMSASITNKPWMSIIPEADIGTYKRAGMLHDLSAGSRPALIVVDVTLGFTGSPGLSLEDAIAEFPTACGPVSWETMPRIRELIGLFRAKGLPIVFTRGDLGARGFAGPVTNSKSKAGPRSGFNDFPEEVAPIEGEWVLEKSKASAFFQTPLTAYLIRECVDTLVFCGVSTSGCVRASVVDGFSHGFRTLVVDDCCFDRSWFSHCSNLFDMQAKYANVLSLHELEPLLSTPARAAAE